MFTLRTRCSKLDRRNSRSQTGVEPVIFRRMRVHALLLCVAPMLHIFQCVTLRTAAALHDAVFQKLISVCSALFTMTMNNASLFSLNLCLCLPFAAEVVLRYPDESGIVYCLSKKECE